MGRDEEGESWGRGDGREAGREGEWRRRCRGKGATKDLMGNGVWGAGRGAEDDGSGVRAERLQGEGEQGGEKPKASAGESGRRGPEGGGGGASQKRVRPSACKTSRNMRPVAQLTAQGTARQGSQARMLHYVTWPALRS